MIWIIASVIMLVIVWFQGKVIRELTLKIKALEIAFTSIINKYGIEMVNNAIRSESKNKEE